MTPSSNKPTATWQDPDVLASDRLDALIADMSLPEKLAQLGSVWLGFEVQTGEVAPMQNVFSQHVSWPESVQEGIGHLTRVFGTGPVTAADGVQRVRELQGTLASRRDLASRPSFMRNALRVHHLRRDRLSDGSRMGRHVRSRTGP
jgi:beta-glucosidase